MFSHVLTPHNSEDLVGWSEWQAEITSDGQWDVRLLYDCSGKIIQA